MKFKVEKSTARPTVQEIAIAVVIAVISAAPPPIFEFLKSLLDTDSSQFLLYFRLLGAACTIAPILAAVLYIHFHQRDFLASSRGPLYLVALSAFALGNLTYIPESILGSAAFMYGQPSRAAWQILCGVPAILVWYITLKAILGTRLALLLEKVTRVPRTRFFVFVILAAVPPLVDFYLAAVPQLYSLADSPVPARPTPPSLREIIWLFGGKLFQHSLQLAILFVILWCCRYRFPRATTTPLMIVLFFVLLLHSSLELIAVVTAAMSRWLFIGILPSLVPLGLRPIVDRSASVLISYCLFLLIFGRSFSNDLGWNRGVDASPGHRDNDAL